MQIKQKRMRHQKKKKRKILVLCDETGRYFGRGLRYRLNCDVITVMKPGATFEGVIENVEQLTKDFSLNDYVCIFAGINNFKNKKYPSIKEISSKLKNCTHTNFIFTSVPYLTHKVNKNFFVDKFNIRFRQFLLKFDKYAEGKIKWIDILDNKGRIDSFNEISNRFLYEFQLKKCSNLIFIKGVEDVEMHYKWYFVSGFKSDRECAHVLRYVKKIDENEQYICEKLALSNESSVSSFKVGVPFYLEKKVLDSNIWPKGILVNNFLEKSHR